MSNQANYELMFWRELFNQNGLEKFLEIRKQDLKDKTEFFPEIFEEKGVGLDLGSGLVSIFRFTDLRHDAYDPLSDEYRKIVPGYYIKEVANTYDWIFCNNVIDHTPDPTALVELIRLHLKPGGRLYFEVNFDDVLSPAHYSLWRIETVREHLKDFKLIKERTFRNPSYPQFIYQAIYEN